MSFWTGTHWERGDPAPPPKTRPSRRRHIVEALAEGALIGLIAVGLVAGSAFAARGGRAHADPPCVVSPSPASVDSWVTLSATGLPTVDPVYLIVQPPSGVSTVGEVYVDQSIGTWSGPEFVDQAGVWTYTFSGLMWNRKYGAVSSCSVEVN